MPKHSKNSATLLATSMGALVIAMACSSTGCGKEPSSSVDENSTSGSEPNPSSGEVPGGGTASSGDPGPGGDPNAGDGGTGGGLDATTGDGGGQADGATTDGGHAKDGATDGAGGDATTGDGGDGDVDLGPRFDGGDSYGTLCPAGTYYFDDFLSDPGTRWRTIAGTWNYDQGLGTWAGLAGSPNALAWIGPRPQWKDYKVTTRMRLDGSTGMLADAGLIFHVLQDGIPDGSTTAPNDAGEMYYVGLYPTQQAVTFGRLNNGWFGLSSASLTVTPDVYYLLEVEVRGSTMAIRVDGVEYLRKSDLNIASGSFGVRSYQQAVTYDWFKVECH